MSRIVGENIRGFRQQKGWSQEKLATRAKLHYNYIGMIERGERGISVDNLHAIAKALGVPINNFLVEGSYKESVKRDK